MHEEFCCIALAVTLIFGCAKPAGNHKMLESDPEKGKATSTSIILQATHILLVRIASADTGSWVKETERTQTRSVQLTIDLQEVLKGNIQQIGHPTVIVAVKQTRIIGSRISAVPGVWSSQPVNTDSRHLVFCRISSTNANEILQEPQTLAVMSPEEGLGDVRRALEIERRHLALPKLIPLFLQRGDSLGPLFAEYMAARLGEVLFGNADDFDVLMSSFESAGLSFRFRGIILSEIYSRFLLADPAPPGFADRLAISTLRIIALPEAAPLHDNLLKTYLPNLLGLEGGATKKGADSIFRRFPGERERAERLLSSYPKPAVAAMVLDWIRR